MRKFFRRALGKANLVAALVLSRLVKTRFGQPLVKLGSDYGGWIIPPSLLGKDSVCYCAGVGEDISFDLELIRRFGCEVYAFDPTPRSAAYVRRVAENESRYHFQPVGLWSEKAVMKFFAPKDPRHVSHSIMNLQGTSDFFEAACERLSDLMRSLGHTRLDLLKMDIEGAEWQVLETLIEDRVSVGILCVEFDQPAAFWRIMRMVKRLRSAGYSLVAVDGWNYAFVGVYPT